MAVWCSLAANLRRRTEGFWQGREAAGNREEYEGEVGKNRYRNRKGVLGLKANRDNGAVVRANARHCMAAALT